MAFDFQNNIDTDNNELSLGSPLKTIFTNHGLTEHSQHFHGEYASRNMREYCKEIWYHKWDISYPLQLLDDTEILLKGIQTQQFPIYLPALSEESEGLRMIYANLLATLNRQFYKCDEANDALSYELYNAMTLYNQKWIKNWNKIKSGKELYYNIEHAYDILKQTFVTAHNHIYVSKDYNSLISMIPICQPYKDFKQCVYYIMHQVYLGLDKLNYVNR